MAKESRDSEMKNELITSHRVLIDIYKGELKCEGKSIERSSIKDNKMQARGSVIVL